MRNFSSKKKESYLRSSRQSLIRAVGILVIAIVCIFLIRTFFGGFLAYVTTPAYQFRTWLVDSTVGVSSYVSDRSALLEEIEKLKEDRAEVGNYDEHLNLLEAENATLRTLLGVKDSEPRILAGVIARPPFLPYDALMIDRGSKDGIEEGAVVYHYSDHVIGIVRKVYSTSALVTLLSTPGVETTVYIIGPDIYTTAQGDGNGTMHVNVPQGVTLTPGDVVILPGLERGIVGKITTVTGEPTEPEQRGFFVSDTPLQSLRFVTVDTRIPHSVTFAEAQQYVSAQKESLFTVDVPVGLLEVGTTSTATSTETEYPYKEGISQ